VVIITSFVKGLKINDTTDKTRWDFNKCHSFKEVNLEIILGGKIEKVKD
jgi:hypothetical protein